VRARPVRRRNGRGFTLIELMIVVAVVAALAAVVIPSFFRESIKKQYDSEVSAIFAEIAVKEEQYKVENGVYFATGTACPATPVAGAAPGIDLTLAGSCLDTASNWVTALRMNPGQTTARCSYQMFAGGTGAAAGPPAGFTFNQGVGQWWYAIATCDIDGAGGTNTQYMTGSSNSVAANGHGFQAINYGQ
jgi:prepilin-type N-terminal cleavage/methylation domain-containing protein